MLAYGRGVHSNGCYGWMYLNCQPFVFLRKKISHGNSLQAGISFFSDVSLLIINNILWIDITNFALPVRLNSRSNLLNCSLHVILLRPQDFTIL